MRKRLMIADDDPDDRDFFREAVSAISPSAECITAANGEEALQKLREPRNALPDIIFFDINMPRVDGMECLRCVKQDSRLKEIDVVLMSTAPSEDYQAEANRLGALGYIVKPHSIQELIQVLSVYIITVLF